MTRTHDHAVPEHVEPGTVVVALLGPPDDFGRSAFLAFWHEDRRHLGGGMVAGQAFHARLGDFGMRFGESGETVTTTAGVLLAAEVSPR